MSDDRFIELETRLSHQDQLLHELNDAVTAQQARLMQLEELCRALIDRVKASGDAGSAGDPADERPPHY